MNNTASTEWSDKWSKIKNTSADADELSLFVDIGKVPKTQRQLNLNNYFLFIREVLSRQKNVKDVMEIGCGRGTTGLYLSKYCGYNLSLLDDSASAIEVAKSEFTKYGERGLFYVKDALNTEVLGGSFDAIVSIGLAEHLPTPDDVSKLFREQYRLLRNGGVMISLNIPKKFSIQELNKPWRLFKKLTRSYKEDIKKDYFRNSLKPRDYKESAEHVGFKNVYLMYVNPFPIYTPLGIPWDKRITKLNKIILKLRGLVQKYPYKTNSIIAQAHFLVGYKR